MSFLNDIKANKPSTNLEGYFVSLLAKSKFGKTTFAVDLVREMYDGDMSKGILLATEVGFKALPDVYAVPITGFDYADEEDGEQRGFIEVVDELIENKDDIPFKFVIIDTITALERYATEYTIRKANRDDSPEVRYKDISDLSWGKGYSALAENIYYQINRLKSNGFGIFVIGHEKTKKVTNRDGFEYDYTTFNAQTKTTDIISREADMIIYGDMVVSKGKGKDDKISSERKLKFRSDGNILCGTRLKNFPSELDLDASVFVDEFKKSILSLYDNDEKAVTKAKKEEVKEEKKKEVTKKESDKKKEDNDPEKIKIEIGNAVKGLDNEVKKGIAKHFKDLLGNADFRKSEDVNKLKEALEHVRHLAE